MNATEILKRLRVFRRTGRNTVELDIDGWTVLLSYGTPVAAIERHQRDSGENCIQGYKTSYPWSRATSRHIREFMDSFPNAKRTVKLMPQDWFNSLIKIEINERAKE